MTTEEFKHIQAIRDALEQLNNDAVDPGCTAEHYADQARTRIVEQIVPALVGIGLDTLEMEPVPSA